MAGKDAIVAATSLHCCCVAAAAVFYFSNPANDQAAFLAAVTELFEEVMIDEEEMKAEIETVSNGVGSMTDKNTPKTGSLPF